ncbi:DNA-binding protein [Streptomyces montanisoli]|uniref:DNA-binding protein n=1 Tax=Streptomyces montanisoli TaxID=2798581 RepID=A0A940M6C9_9ACTN|nr:DNA-binding protein [Streptomyces montanisoli]MBP0457005.1 DNA-binding protein [Streptomyces montanisoli]
MSPGAMRLSQWLTEPVPLRTVADLLGVDASKAPGLVRAHRFPCRVTKVKGRYVASAADVMQAMGIDDPIVRTGDLLAGADFARRWD